MTNRRTDRRWSDWRTGASLLSLFVSLIGVGSIQADEREAAEFQSREFKVSVDGKPRGKCVMQIERFPDGRERMHVESQLSFNYVVYEYRYSSAGTEVWKSGRLIELDNTADYNGTKYQIQVRPARDGLKLSANGKGSRVGTETWATSYWRLPEFLTNTPGRDGVTPAGGERPAQKAAPIAVQLLDSDQGKLLKGELVRVGVETIQFGEQRKKCARYRVAGDVQAELWYDSERRLARQESVDQGHKTLLELTKVSDRR